MRSNYTMKMRASVLVAAIAATLLLGKSDAVLAANEPENSTPQQVFDGMRESFQADKAKGVHARYQWALSGPNGGGWWIEVDDGSFQRGRGKMDNPSVMLLTSDNDWVVISNGKHKDTWDLMNGRLK